MTLIARKVVNSLDKEIIVKSGSEYWLFKSVQIVNTSELQWLHYTESQVKRMIKGDGWKTYKIEAAKAKV